MVYRPTERTKTRKADVRKKILNETQKLIAAGGFSAASVNSVAKHVGIASGTVYRYFPSKALLFAEVTNRVCQYEIDVLAEISGREESPAQRLKKVIETVSRRALEHRNLAYALIAEPVDPLVDAERLIFRQVCAGLMETLVAEGIKLGEFPEQNIAVSSAALVGILAETLVGPLSSHPTNDRTGSEDQSAQTVLHSHWNMRVPPELDDEQLVQSITKFCFRALGGVAH